MVQMVNTINATNFSGRKVVSCWTCHRQSDRPRSRRRLDVVYGEPIYWAPDDLFQQAQGAPKPDEVLDKYIQAVGGADRLSRLTSFVGKGSATLFGGGFKSPVELYVKGPDQRTTDPPPGARRQDHDLRRPRWLARVGGHAGAGDGPDRRRTRMAPGSTRNCPFQAASSSLLSQWRANLPREIDGRPVNVLQGTGTGGLTATLFFDVESGLLTRVVRYANSAMGRVPTQLDFEDYRDVAGVKVPFKWSFAWVSGRDVVELTEVQPNVAIDAAKFAKPAPAVAPK